MTSVIPGAIDSNRAVSPGDSVTAEDVVRGIGRLFAAQGIAMLAEVPLPNGRRTDVSAISKKGEIIIVEVKVSRSDLLGDCKWRDYLQFCDRFFWALPPGLSDEPLYTESYMPEISGIIRADRYGAAIIRQSSLVPLAAARRKAETLRFARLAAGRLFQLYDPISGPTISENGWL